MALRFGALTWHPAGAVTIPIPEPTGSRAIYAITRIAGNNDLIIAPASGFALSPEMSVDEQIVMPLGQSATFLDALGGVSVILFEYLPEASYPTLSAPAPQTTHKAIEMTITFSGARP